MLFGVMYQLVERKIIGDHSELLLILPVPETFYLGYDAVSLESDN